MNIDILVRVRGTQIFVQAGEMLYVEQHVNTDIFVCWGDVVCRASVKIKFFSKSWRRCV